MVDKAALNVEFTTQFHVGSVPEYGLSEREMVKYAEDVEFHIAMAQHGSTRETRWTPSRHSPRDAFDVADELSHYPRGLHESAYGT